MLEIVSLMSHLYNKYFDTTEVEDQYIITMIKKRIVILIQQWVIMVVSSRTCMLVLHPVTEHIGRHFDKYQSHHISDKEMISESSM